MKTVPNLDLVVDTNGLFAQSYYAAVSSNELKYDKHGYLVAAFKCFFSALKNDVRIPERVLFCFDGKAKTKKPRPPKPPDWYDKLSYFQKTIQDAFGKEAFVLHPDHEADDTVATVACRMANQGRDVVVMSGDKDLQQLKTDKVLYYCLNKKRLLSAQDICDKWAINQPVQVAIALAIIGDKPDGINGVDKMGHGAVQKLFNGLPKDATLQQVVSRAVTTMKTAEQRDQFFESLEYTLLHLDVVTDACPIAFNPVATLPELEDTRAGDEWQRSVLSLDPDLAMSAVENWNP